MYGLLGKNLSHSFSKRLHEKMGEEQYRLYETDDVSDFFKTVSFKGMNVTHPYKQEVIEHLDALDETAREAGVVNTIVRTKCGLKGYNTDCLALLEIVKRRFPSDKDILVGILGNGATMRSMKYALLRSDYRNIAVYARNPRSNEQSFNHIDSKVQVLINTTPVGMYPNNGQMLPVDLHSLPNLTLVFDVIYNPFETRLLLEAKSMGVKTVNGLEMLVRQALESRALFKMKGPRETNPSEWTGRIERELKNIVLIGLPFSGKTHFGKLLSKAYDRPFIDLDRRIETEQNASIEELFQTKGEAFFRRLEKNAVETLGKEHGQVLATGGGVVLDGENVKNLAQNGVLVFLDLDLRLLEKQTMNGRPLIKSFSDLQALQNKRQPLYEHCSDIVIPKTTWDERVTLRRIQEGLDAYFDRERTELESSGS